MARSALVLDDPNGCEQARLQALDRYDILDTPAEESFDRITRLTKALFGVPMATIAFLDAHRQWFKSRDGVAACETDRKPALCNVTIRERQALIVEDTLLDARFAKNPLVIDGPKLRFYAGVPLIVPQGGAIGTLCVMDTAPRLFAPDQAALLADLARMVLTELELRTVATTDVLTGVLSRRAFMRDAERTLALAIRHRTAVSCIALDLDHFKTINDRFGHGAGDRVLTDSARACSDILRRTDLFGRIGGEEFAILLPHTGLAAALGVAEKLRAALARQTIALPSGETIRVTGSFGVAALDRATPDLRALLDYADEALYAAKNAGRDRCHAWTPPAVGPAPAARRRVFKAGTISARPDALTMDCTVHRLSNDGAALAVVSTDNLPETFCLQIETDDVSKLCRIVTKTARHLEVQFQ